MNRQVRQGRNRVAARGGPARVDTGTYVEPPNARQTEVLRRMTGERRFRIGFEISDFVTRLVIAGIRHRHPGLSEPEVRERLKESYRT